MQIISPVLNGNNQAATIPATTNFTVGNAAPDTTNVIDSTSTDSRRYSKFDRSASQVSDSEMSFGDFLDMINPLQHIPVVSSVYREITGDKISPVARVGGNILYGAIFGVAGAVVGGIGAVADSMLEGQTGKDMTGTVVAALFGDDKDATDSNAAATQLASNSTTHAMQQAVNARPNTLLSVTQQTMASDAAAKAKAAAEKAGTAPAADPSQGMALARAIPLNRSPYGGVMAPLPPTRTYHDENLAMSMAQATGGIHVGNVIYANRLKDGARAVPAPVPAAPQVAAAQTTTTPTAPAPAAATGPTITALPASGSDAMAQAEASQMMATGPLPATPVPAATVPSAGLAGTTMPPGLADDALIMKALGLYRNVADGTQGSVN